MEWFVWLIPLTNETRIFCWDGLLHGRLIWSKKTFQVYWKEVPSNNRSGMPLDVLGRTRATLLGSTCFTFFFERGVYAWLRCLANHLNTQRDGARVLQLWLSNEEFLVWPSHQLVQITSLPFVHTARRTYRLSVPLRWLECFLLPLRVIFNIKFSKTWHLEEGEVVTRFP